MLFFLKEHSENGNSINSNKIVAKTNQKIIHNYYSDLGCQIKGLNTMVENRNKSGQIKKKF